MALTKYYNPATAQWEPLPVTTVSNSGPIGTLLEYAGSDVPDGYLLCDGSAVSRSVYADLYAVCGTTFGVGDGSTTFNLPNQPKGETISAAGTGAQSAASGADLIYTACTLTLPPGTWEIQGMIVGQTNTLDGQTASIYNVTAGGEEPSARGDLKITGVPPDANGLWSRAITRTLTVTTQFRMILGRNGGSAASVPGTNLANTSSAIMDARRLPYNQAKSVIKFRIAAGETVPTPARMVGEISEWAGTAAPTGYLLCDGSVLGRTTFPDLFAVIGTTYNTGGEASTDFRLPNRKGKVGVGRDAADTAFDVMGETGGAKTHTLTVGEMPSHQHSEISSVATSFLSQSGPTYGVSIPGSAQTGLTGGGGPHNNLQPYIVLNYIIKAIGYIASAARDATPYRMIGEMFAWGGNTNPTGTLECNGSAISRTVYPELFTAIGTTHGAGDGSTTFNLPDLRGRVPVGQDTTQTEFDVLGETGGTKAETLSTAQMPSHSHNILIGLGGNTNSLARVSGYFAGGTGVTETSAPAPVQATGGGGSHNNLQPYAVMRWLIKATWTPVEIPMTASHTHRVMDLSGIAHGTATPTGGVHGDLYLKHA